MMSRDGSLPLPEGVDYDALARISQQFLSERPVVVLGTGATIPHGLPSMTGLANALLTLVDPTLPGWSAFSQVLDQTKDLERTLHEVVLAEETLDALVAATWKIVAEKDNAFLDLLLQQEVAFPLADLLRYLLRTAEPHVHVVTPNYDRLAEYAANQARAEVSTGMTPGWIQRFVPAAVDPQRRTGPGFEGKVTVLKVHGSLDWFRDTAANVVSAPSLPTPPAGMRPLIVTPGSSKYREVHKDPFRTVMTAADAALQTATSYLCVGYGFNDEHVQPVLVSRVMKEHIPLVLITKALTPSTQKAFLDSPPRKFLLMEDSGDGTRIFSSDYPKGTVLKGESLWELGAFMEMITAEEQR